MDDRFNRLEKYLLRRKLANMKTIARIQKSRILLANKDIIEKYFKRG